MTKPKPKGKRGRPKVMPDDQRRALIVAEAEKLFVERGFNGTSTEQIAAHCQISKQTLYRLFPCKIELFAAVVESHRLSMIDLGDGYDDLPLDQALARIFMIGLDQPSYELRAAFLRAAHVESVQHPELREILRSRGGERTRTELAAWLDRQCAKGRLVIDDPDNTAHMLMDMFTGAVIFEAIGGFGWATREERMAHFRVCIDTFLNGTLPGSRRS
ncbi:TetR family transcriptional regulator [Pseudodesulfovibrio cashew]|uniref:TetR family transcriptional regulator n=1 Tax=Pseudodesulfovibrio cashew TaxID=2678688 RepID=A0A6I6JFK0_9BACT|nr:TetR/AcrR family transcriptional regulator [Pseudodesulfovibrio cashew]QGY39293.1 TetR family transcriptional regulator [Pseudodesulfovibrio cashew]